MHDEDYEACFRTLGVPPDADWESVRAAYRRLAQRVHPDRGDGEGDEAFKRISRAFKVLSDYHRRHGTLPDVSRRSRDELLAPRHGARRRERAGAYGPATAGRARPGRFRAGRLVAVVAVAGAGAWFVLHDGADGPRRIGYEAPEGAARGEPVPATAAGSGALYFSYGASKEDVLAIQGRPTRVEGETWYYGRSRIHFDDGVVVNWEIDLSHPLRIRLPGQAREVTPRFTYGASKSEVRAIEGEPDRETETQWEYGLSRVYFKDGAVVGWDSNPVRPLNVYE